MNWVKTTTLAVLVGLALTAPVYPQDRYSAQMEEYERSLEKLEAKLDALSKQRAGEYLDVLERLHDVLEEYSGYMEELSRETGVEHQGAIDSMMNRLENGGYADNPDRLLDDIDTLIDDIKAVENQLRVKYDSNNPKGSAVLRSFRRELIIIAELVEDYTDQQMAQLLKKSEMSDYIREALKSALAALGRLPRGERPDEDIPDDFPTLPDIPPVPRVEVPRVPSPPETPSGTDVFDQWRRGRGDKAGRVQSYSAQMTVTKSSLPVIIKNTAGDLIMTGWSDKTVSAVLGIEVSAGSGEREKEFVSQTSLKVDSKPDGYYVYSNLPRIRDLKTEVLRSRLVVNVPAGNRVVCSNSYGNVSVTDVDEGVRVESDNSNLNLGNIRGKIDIDNTMGPVLLTDITGDLTVQNTYAPIEVRDCEGTMDLENAYNLISLSDNRGSVMINNTGQVRVTDHLGDVDIDNLYGQVDLSDIEGNVKVSNGYQPLLARSISGSVKADNSYSQITLDDIGGVLSVANNTGPITLASVRGPVDVTNQNATINLVLDRDFTGRSTVTSIGGTIVLKIAERPNLLLRAHTTGGDITSNLPISVVREGVSKSAELILGEGGEALDLSGTNSSIIITGRY